MKHKIAFEDSEGNCWLESRMTTREHCLLAYRCAALSGMLSGNDLSPNNKMLVTYADSIAQAMLALDEQDN